MTKASLKFDWIEFGDLLVFPHSSIYKKEGYNLFLVTNHPLIGIEKVKGLFLDTQERCSWEDTVMVNYYNEATMGVFRNGKMWTLNSLLKERFKDVKHGKPQKVE